MSPVVLDRRTFLVSSAGAFAGLVIAFHVPWLKSAFAEPEAEPKALPPPNAFVRIGEDESVTVILAHSEMGQGIWTGLPMLLAEELGVDWRRVRSEHAPAAPEYFNLQLHRQLTGGSTSTKTEFDRYRQAGALAREMLIAAAAKRWNANPKDCRVENGFVVLGDKRLSYGALAREASTLTPPKSVALKPRSEWTVIGHDTKRMDSPEKVTGRAIFGLDVRMDGLLVAVVARSPTFGGKVAKFSADKAKAVPGVKTVIEIPSGIAVVAEHTWAAKLGRDALEIEWDPGAGAAFDSAKTQAEYRTMADRRGTKAVEKGDALGALKSEGSKLEVDYEFPYLAHATMEPMNATARVTAEGCELWLPTQGQTGDQDAVAKALGLPVEKVNLHTTFLGGGFGRRGTQDGHFAVEAALVSKAVGAPVKVVWTREDDMKGGWYRPMFLHRIRVRANEKGVPVAWHQTIVGQSIMAQSPLTASSIKNGIDRVSVEGASDSPYLEDVPDRLVELHSPTQVVPILWWRSVGHTHTGFAMESIADELAAAAKRDPVEYRRERLAKKPRHLRALETAAKAAKWGEALPPGHARGVAVHESFGSFVAVIVEISVEGKAIRLHRAVSVMDCGTCVNPNAVRAQLEGAFAFGATAALYGEITLAKGQVEQSNFHDYPLLRIPEMPTVEAIVLPSDEKPGGAGEPGVPPVAPAIANAVFALTGKRLRRLPLRLA